MKESFLGLIITIFTIIFTIKISGASLHTMFCISSVILILGCVFGALITSFSIKDVMKSFKLLFSIEGASSEDKAKSSMLFDAAGKYSLAFGFLGVLINIVYCLSNLTDGYFIGQYLARAFMSIIYGFSLAFIFFFPISMKIKNK